MHFLNVYEEYLRTFRNCICNYEFKKRGIKKYMYILFYSVNADAFLIL